MAGGPGTVRIDRATLPTVALFLSTKDPEPTTVFAASAGGDSALWHFAEARYRSTVAAVERAIGKPTVEFLRTKLTEPPPEGLDPMWARASLWEGRGHAVVVALSGGPGLGLEVTILRGAWG